MSRNYSPHDDHSDDSVGLILGLYEQINQVTADPEIDPHMTRIRQGIFLLVDDGDNIEPPPGLARKTMARVHQKSILQDQFRETVIPRRQWRISDIAIAASIMFAMFLGSFPALNRARFTASNVACSANLSQLWQGAELYSQSFNVYPSALAQNQQMPAGASLLLLRHTGHLNDSVPLTCPGCSRQIHFEELPAWHEIEKDYARHVQQLESALKEAYAVHPGLGGPDGLKHLSRNMSAGMRSNLPLFGDRPAPTTFWSQMHLNSDSHGGLGQNVVFADGHVEFSKSRRFHNAGDDIYTNHKGEVSPPSSPEDMILVPAWFRFGR